MTKKIFIRFMLIVMSAAILIGVFLVGRMFNKVEERGVIEVYLTENGPYVHKFDAVGLVPGDSREYLVKLSRPDVDHYYIKFDFVELEDKALKEFLRVKLVSGEEILLDELLESTFEDELIIFPVDFANSKNTEIRVIYYLPLEVGNEAKNAEASFELVLSATNG